MQSGYYLHCPHKEKDVLNSEFKNVPFFCLAFGQGEWIHPEFKGIHFSVHCIWMISSRTVFDAFKNPYLSLNLQPLDCSVCLLNMGTWLSHRHLSSACAKLTSSSHLQNIYLLIYSFCWFCILLVPPCLGELILLVQWLEEQSEQHTAIASLDNILIRGVRLLSQAKRPFRQQCW